MRSLVTTACAGMVFALGAHAQQGPLELGAGLHYSTGDYGTGSETEITTLAFTGRYDSGPWVYRATIPYLEVTGDNAVIPGVGRARGGGGRRRTESGLGDVVLSATYAAISGLDLTGKLKLPTADETRGLGTGEADAIFLADAYHGFDRWTGFGGIGYHILGDAPGQPFDNVWSANAGASYKIDARDTWGVSFDTRQRVAPSAAPQREVMGYFQRKLDAFWKAQAYVLIGLANGSPDWGIGLSLARPM
jgi:hypothetical protein